jgi:hypothetical protein
VEGSGSRRRNALALLEAGVAELTQSERWCAWLVVQSRFPRYSFANTVLIGAQRPDATRVAGFGTWRRLGRRVRAGERALWILAPVLGRPGEVVGDGDEPGARVLRGFRPVGVFDVAQTEGRPLPEVVGVLEGRAPEGGLQRLTRAAEGLGFAVALSDRLGPGVHGDCDHGSRRLRLRGDDPPVQQLKTLAHELGHAVLHPPEERDPDRGLLELEAESVAFVVCAELGVASGTYSFGYVAGWAGGGEPALAALRRSGVRIQQAAATILGAPEPAPG